MEKEKTYLNKDLYGQSYDEFCDAVKMPELGDDFIERLEWSLMLLSGKYSDMRIGGAIRSYSLGTFDGAWLIDVEKLGGQDDKLIFFSPLGGLQAGPEIIPNLNIKTLSIGEMAQLQKFRTVELKDRRHIPLSKLKNVTEWRLAHYDTKRESWYGHEQGLGYNGFMKTTGEEELNAILPAYISLQPGYAIREPFYYLKDEDGKLTPEARDIIKGLNMAYQISLTGYYEWFVYIRETDKSLGIKVPILPEASKEVFAMRDIPEGGKRKKAICNFVSQHYRTINASDYNNEAREVLVRKHLRGENKFNWRGLQVNIIPSDYDLNRVKTSKKFLRK